MTPRKPPSQHKLHYKTQRVPQNSHPLVKLLFVEMNAQQLTMKELAERSGVRRETIRQWKTRANPLLTHVDACLNVLGVRIIAAEMDDDQVEAWRRGEGSFSFRRYVYRNGHPNALQDDGATHA